MARGGKRKQGKYEGQGLKEFRSKVAKLKKKGIISKKVDARSQAATSYMRKKVNAFQDVLEGSAVAVRAKPDVRRQYEEAGIFRSVGPFIKVPKEHANERVTIKKGKYIEKTRALPTKTGGRVVERRLILPVQAGTLSGIIDGIEQHAAEIDKGLKGDEQLFFRVYGHNSGIGFPEITGPEGLVPFFRNRYAHLLRGVNNERPAPRRKWVNPQYFELLSYNGGREPPPSPEAGRLYSEPGQGRRPRVDATGRNSGRKSKLVRDWEERERQARNTRKTRYRKNETDEQRTKRLNEQRERTRRNRRGEYTKGPKK